MSPNSEKTSHQKKLFPGGGEEWDRKCEAHLAKKVSLFKNEFLKCILK